MSSRIDQMWCGATTQHAMIYPVSPPKEKWTREFRCDCGLHRRVITRRHYNYKRKTRDLIRDYRTT